MNRMPTFRMGNSGSAAFLGSVSLGILVTSILGVLYLAEGSHQKVLLNSATMLESYYTNEIAQWNGYERTSQGVDIGLIPDAKGFFNCNISNSYAAALPTLKVSFAKETYDEHSADGFAYSLKTTSEFDSIGSLNFRLAPGNLHYQVINK